MTAHADTQAISLNQLRGDIDAISMDVCDQCAVINVTMEKMHGSHDNGYALVRAIKSFSDQIFQKLEAVQEKIYRLEQQGGAQ